MCMFGRDRPPEWRQVRCLITINIYYFTIYIVSAFSIDKQMNVRKGGQLCLLEERIWFSIRGMESPEVGGAVVGASTRGAPTEE